MSEPRLFTLIRYGDESGISGTGRVLDGVMFHTGQVVVCWRTDINAGKPGYSSIAVYPSWEAFLAVHVQPHPSNATEIRFGVDANLDTTTSGGIYVAADRGWKLTSISDATHGLLMTTSVSVSSLNALFAGEIYLYSLGFLWMTLNTAYNAVYVVEARA